MGIVDSIIGGGQLPAVTAFLLGLIVALHPCPLATNIAAMGYIAKDGAAGKRVFARGIVYTIGRVAGYALLGVVLVAVIKGGVDILSLGNKIGEWGERLLGPILIIIGLYLLATRFIHKEEHCHTVNGMKYWTRGWGGCFLLGMLLALSFCPESAIIYFGMIIPMSADVHAGYLIPVSFAVATSIPAFILAWCFAYGIKTISAMRGKMHVLQQWINTIVAILFIAAGIFCLIF